MAKGNTNELLTILAAGVTKTYPVTDTVDIYEIRADGGAVVLAGNVSIAASGSPVRGTTYTFIIGGGFTLGANTFTVFGASLTAAMVLYKCKAFCYYTGAAWDVYIDLENASANVNIPGTSINSGTLTNTQISNVAAIAWAKLAAAPAAARGHFLRSGVNGVVESASGSTAGRMLIGDGTDVISVAMSGDGTLAGTGAMTIANNAITTVKITDANVTVAKVSADLKAELIVFPVSFESGEQTTYKIRMPYPGSVVHIYAECIKAIAATDAATITPKNNAGTNMTVTTPISFAASDPLTTAYSSAITADNTFVGGDFIQFTMAKVTAGGKALVTVEITRS